MAIVPTGNTKDVPPDTFSDRINYYNREEALLAEDLQRFGAINLSEHKRLLANSKNANGIFWKTVFTRLYGTIPGSSGGGIADPDPGTSPA